MKKIMRNKFGFTLVELMLTIGVFGIVSLIAFTALRSSNETGVATYLTSESTFLKNLVVANLSNSYSCEYTFKGTSPTRTGIVLKDKRNATFLSAGSQFGEKKRQDMISITEIRSAPTAGSSNNLDLTITYAIDNSLKSNRTKNTNSFTINIYYKLDTVTGNIDNCLVNYSSLMKDAVKASCQGNAAFYEPVELLSPADQTNFPSGRCTHRIHVLNNTAAGSDAAVVSGTVACPAGQFLVDVSTSTTAGDPHDHRPVFKCQAMQVSCPSGTYLQSVAVDGTPTCKAMTTLVAEAPGTSAVASGNAINVVGVLAGKRYQGINLNCPTDKVLKRVDANGQPVCVDKVITKVCPPGQYVSDVVGDGSTVNCKMMPRASAACTGNSYIHAIYSNGSFVCATNTFAGDCPTGIRAVDNSGAVSCY